MDELVQQLADGRHPVEVRLRPERTIEAFRESLAGTMRTSSSPIRRVGPNLASPSIASVPSSIQRISTVARAA